MARDAQWGKICRITEQLGAAEPALRGAANEAELQEFVDRVIRSKWFGSRFPGLDDRPKVHVELKNHGWCNCPMKLHKIGRKTYTAYWWPVAKDWETKHGALHAICHFLVTSKDDQPYHNAEFCHTFVLAVGRFLGKPAEAEARRLFKENKVKLYKWSPEARARAAERATERQFASAGDRLAQLASRLEGDDW